jgi:ATP-dependent RNA helicase DDX49/DBP8
MSCEHIMAAPKALARSLPIKPLSEEASDLNSGSESPSQSSNASSDSDSDSDSLDSHASRKRRKVSPVEVDAPLLPTTSVPSRIKSKVQDNGTIKQTSNGAMLAPLHSTTTFAALNVKPWLVGSLGAMAINRPTGIQKGCIPEILKGRDCIGGSRTGSGKTVAFAVPILQKWAEDPFGIFALVLTPTRYATLLGRHWIQLTLRV